MEALTSAFVRVRAGRRAAGIGVAFGGLVVVALGLTGCGDPPIASYRVPKAMVTAPPTESPVAGLEPGAQSSARWTVPGGWKPLAAGQMQLARFSVPDRGDAHAEVSVSVFTSETGGALSNVNRWRGQIGLSPISEDELSRQATPLDPTTPGAILVDLSNGGRQLVAAIVPRGGQWYFYKLLGDAAAVAPEIDAFAAFARSEP